MREHWLLPKRWPVASVAVAPLCFSLLPLCLSLLLLLLDPKSLRHLLPLPDDLILGWRKCVDELVWFCRSKDCARWRYC